MEGTLAACSPEVNMLSILSMHMSSMIYDHFNWKKELIHRGRTAYASLDKSMEIPSQLSDLLNITKNGQTKLNMELTDADDFMKLFVNLSVTLCSGSSHPLCFLVQSCFV